MDDRNRIDRNREHNIDEADNLAYRGVYTREDYDRADRQERLQRVYEKTDSSLFGKIAQIASLGLGAYALGKAVPKDIWIDAGHKLGMIGRKPFERFLAKRDEVITQVLGGKAKISREHGRGTELTDILSTQVRNLVDDLRQNYTRGNSVNQAKEQTRRALEGKFGSIESGSSRYKVVTVSDIMEMAKRKDTNVFNVIDRNSYNALINTRNWLGPNNSNWFDKLALDAKLYQRNGSIADLRSFSLRSVGNVVRKAIDRPIPFTSFSPYSIIKPFIDIAGRGQLIGRVGSGIKISEGIETPKQGISYVIDHKLFNFGRSSFEAIAPEKNFTAHNFDALGLANAAKLGNLSSQKLRKSNKPGFFRALQDAIGIGPKFRTEASIVGKVLSAFSTYADNLTYKGKNFAPFENIRANDLPFLSKLKLQASNAGDFNPDAVVRSPYRNTQFGDLNFFEKLKHLLGFGKLGEFRGRKSGGLLGTKTVPNKPVTGFRNLRMGELSPSGSNKVPIENYAIESSLTNKLSILAHHSTIRLNNLIGATIGIGFRPSSGSAGYLGNAIKIGLIGLAFNPINGLAFDAASYVNYLFQEVTSGFGVAPWDGVGPIDLIRKGYKYSTLAAAGAKDLSGITSFAKYSEDLMPGLWNSPLSGFARTAGLSILGTKLGGRKGALAGFGLSLISGSVSDIFGPGALAGANTTTDFSTLSSYYSGDKKVPIKSGRWWGMGRSSFYGEGIERFEPHWLALQESNWKYSNVLYGSQGEYFKYQSLLPTPHNLFGLLRDNNYYADKLKDSRPYPVDANGNIRDDYVATPKMSSLPRGLNIDDVNALGYAVPDPLRANPVSEESMGVKFKKSFDNLTEFLGIYKFLGESIFGSMETGPVMQSASNITDATRLYWDKDLGGLFGHTELLRRYMPKPNSIGISEFVNEIPNQMPEWMPGARSVYKKDRSYFKDFTIGDPYALVKGGEYRLPGSGYESVNKLHSGSPGTYSEVDALLILADVAPFSEAYSQMKRKVSKLELTEEWRNRVTEAITQRDTVVKGYASDFKTKKFTNPSINDINATVQYSALEKGIGSFWERTTFDVIPEISRIIPFGGMVSNKLLPNFTAEQDYLQRQVYGAKFADWNRPYETFLRPRLYNLYNENPVTASLGGGAMGFVLGSTPYGSIAGAIAGGTIMGSASIFRSVQYGRIEGGYIPESRIAETEMVDYFDKLEYLRLQKAKDKAIDIGRSDIYHNLNNLQKTRTMVGMDVSDIKMGMGGIPKPERFYVEAFRNSNNREQITNMVPQYMKNIYNKAWGTAYPSESPGSSVDRYFTKNYVPDEEWEGWNPSVQKWEIMARTADSPDNSVAIDIHRQHISTSMSRQSETKFANLGLPLTNIESDNREWTLSTRQKLYMESKGRQNGYKPKITSYRQSSYRNNSEYNNNFKYQKRSEIIDGY